MSESPESPFEREEELVWEESEGEESEGEETEEIFTSKSHSHSNCVDSMSKMPWLIGGKLKSVNEVVIKPITDVPRTWYSGLNKEISEEKHEEWYTPSPFFFKVLCKHINNLSQNDKILTIPLDPPVKVMIAARVQYNDDNDRFAYQNEERFEDMKQWFKCSIDTVEISKMPWLLDDKIVKVVDIVLNPITSIPKSWHIGQISEEKGKEWYTPSPLFFNILCNGINKLVQNGSITIIPLPQTNVEVIIGARVKHTDGDDRLVKFNMDRFEKMLEWFHTFHTLRTRTTLRMSKRTTRLNIPDIDMPLKQTRIIAQFTEPVSLTMKKCVSNQRTKPWLGDKFVRTLISFDQLQRNVENFEHFVVLDSAIDISGRTWYRPSTQFYELECDGRKIEIVSDNGLYRFYPTGVSEAVDAVYIYIMNEFRTSETSGTSETSMSVQDRKTYSSELKWKKADQMSMTEKVNSIINTPIDPILFESMLTLLTYYINTIIDSDIKVHQTSSESSSVSSKSSSSVSSVSSVSSSSKSTGSETYTTVIINILREIYNSNPQISFNELVKPIITLIVYTTNPIAIYNKTVVTKVRKGYFSPRSLFTLSLEDLFPAFYLNTKKSDIDVASVQTFVDTQISNMNMRIGYELFYALQGGSRRTCPEPVWNMGVPNAIKEIEKVKCANELLSQESQEVQYVMDDGTILCYNINELLEQFNDGNYNIPDMEHDFTKEWVDDFMYKYNYSHTSAGGGVQEVLGELGGGELGILGESGELGGERSVYETSIEAASIFQDMMKELTTYEPYEDPSFKWVSALQPSQPRPNLTIGDAIPSNDTGNIGDIFMLVTKTGSITYTKTKKGWTTPKIPKKDEVKLPCYLCKKETVPWHTTWIDMKSAPFCSKEHFDTVMNPVTLADNICFGCNKSLSVIIKEAKEKWIEDTTARWNKYKNEWYESQLKFHKRKKDQVAVREKLSEQLEELTPEGEADKLSISELVPNIRTIMLDNHSPQVATFCSMKCLDKRPAEKTPPMSTEELFEEFDRAKDAFWCSNFCKDVPIDKQADCITACTQYKAQCGGDVQCLDEALKVFELLKIPTKSNTLTIEQVINDIVGM